jgi:hypothetical protein
MKNRTKYLGYLIIFVLSIIIMNLNHQIHKVRVYDKALIDSLSKDDIEISNNNVLFKNLIVNFYSYERLYWKKSQILYNKNGDSIKIDRVLENKNKIIFNFSEFNCEICIQEELKILKEVCSAIGSDNVIIIGNFLRNRDLGILLKSMQLESQCYYSTHFSILPEIDGKNLPYVFISGLDYMASELFIINKNSEILTRLYYQIVLKKYFNNDSF